MQTQPDVFERIPAARNVLHASLVLIANHHGAAVSLAAAQGVDTLGRAGSMTRADLETAIAIELDTDPENLDRLRLAVDALVALNVVRCLGDARLALNELLASELAPELDR